MSKHNKHGELKFGDNDGHRLIVLNVDAHSMCNVYANLCKSDKQNAECICTAPECVSTENLISHLGTKSSAQAGQFIFGVNS